MIVKWPLYLFTSDSLVNLAITCFKPLLFSLTFSLTHCLFCALSPSSLSLSPSPSLSSTLPLSLSLPLSRCLPSSLLLPLFPPSLSPSLPLPLLSLPLSPSLSLPLSLSLSLSLSLCHSHTHTHTLKTACHS